uniref:FAST kinase domains 5 n=1 Tax=Stegastes partitus TaxID=144197 RepID=A0A3B4ZQ76_9TELE
MCSNELFYENIQINISCHYKTNVINLIVNIYLCVRCSRFLSSSKHTLLDLGLNKSPEPQISSGSLHHRQPAPTDFKVITRAFLKCRPEYASMSLDLTQRPHPINWTEGFSLLRKVNVLKGSMKPSDVCQFLVGLSRLHPDNIPTVRADQRFVVLLRYSVENLGLFTHPQLLEVLQAFVWLDIPSTHTILELYEAELSRRASQMSLHQLLLAADMWRCIGKQVPQFLQHLYDSVYLSLGQVGVPELVHLLYIMGEGRQCPKKLIHPLQQLVLRHLQQLHPEEVGTVCLGFFKAQTSISESAVTRIVDKALSFVPEMSDFAIVNVLKFMRFSYLFHRPWLEAMAQEIPQRAHRMKLEGVMHVALTCSAMHYRNDDILSAIAERVPSLVSHCRSKDSGKLLWAYGTVGFLPAQNPSFYSGLTEVLRQQKSEFLRYPEHLLTGLLGLAFVSQFPEDLIAFALSPDFVNLALKKKDLELKKDLFTLDGTVALELPHWTGPRLSNELREEVTDMLWKFVQSDVCQKPEVQEAESALQDLLGGEKFVCKRMILPHNRSIDLEVHLDSTGEPIPVNPVSSEQNPSSPSSRVKPTAVHRLQPDEGGRVFESVLDLTGGRTQTRNKPSSFGSARQKSKGTVKLAVQVMNRNHYCSQSDQLLGFHAMKRRQLQMVGYRVVELCHHEWIPLVRKCRTHKLAYLHCKLFDKL